MHMMIDVETLDTRPTAAIISIGAKLFDERTGLSPDYVESEFYVRVNMDSMLKGGLYNFTQNADTIQWWTRQPEEARAILSAESQATAQPIWEALNDFEQFVGEAQMAEANRGGEIEGYWAQGQDFDFPILANAFRQVRAVEAGSQVPWPFWLQRDTRTVYAEHGFDTEDVNREGTHHNALDDCRHQVHCLICARKLSFKGVLR